MEGQRAQETPSGIPYIGSLIALTSASGQRYRGTLYTVDLNESTIALQNGGFLMPLLHACQLFAFLHADILTSARDRMQLLWEQTIHRRDRFTSSSSFEVSGFWPPRPTEVHAFRVGRREI